LFEATVESRKFDDLLRVFAQMGEAPNDAALVSALVWCRLPADHLPA
jgi:hypothetical protein